MITIDRLPAFRFLHNLPIRIQYPGTDNYIFFQFLFIGNGGSDLHSGFRHRNLWCRYIYFPLIDMQGVCDDQFYMTVNPGSTVPAAVLSFINYADCNHIFFTCRFAKLCNIKKEGSISMFVITQEIPIDPYIGFSVYAFEINGYPFAFIIICKCKCFAIPPGAADYMPGRISVVRSLTFFGKRSDCFSGNLSGRQVFYAPIMWEINNTPCRILICGLLGADNTVFYKTPVAIEVADTIGGYIFSRLHAPAEKATKDREDKKYFSGWSM